MLRAHDTVNERHGYGHRDCPNEVSAARVSQAAGRSTCVIGLLGLDLTKRLLINSELSTRSEPRQHPNDASDGTSDFEWEDGAR